METPDAATMVRIRSLACEVIGAVTAGAAVGPRGLSTPCRSHNRSDRVGAPDNSAVAIDSVNAPVGMREVGRRGAAGSDSGALLLTTYKLFSFPYLHSTPSSVK